MPRIILDMRNKRFQILRLHVNALGYEVNSFAWVEYTNAAIRFNHSGENHLYFEYLTRSENNHAIVTAKMWVLNIIPITNNQYEILGMQIMTSPGVIKRRSDGAADRVYYKTVTPGYEFYDVFHLEPPDMAILKEVDNE